MVCICQRQRVGRGGKETGRGIEKFELQGGGCESFKRSLFCLFSVQTESAWTQEICFRLEGTPGGCFLSLLRSLSNNAHASACTQSELVMMEIPSLSFHIQSKIKDGCHYFLRPSFSTCVSHTISRFNISDVSIFLIQIRAIIS